MKHVVEH